MPHQKKTAPIYDAYFYIFSWPPLKFQAQTADRDQNTLTVTECKRILNELDTEDEIDSALQQLEDQGKEGVFKRINISKNKRMIIYWYEFEKSTRLSSLTETYVNRIFNCHIGIPIDPPICTVEVAELVTKIFADKREEERVAMLERDHQEAMAKRERMIQKVETILDFADKMDVTTVISSIRKIMAPPPPPQSASPPLANVAPANPLPAGLMKASLLSPPEVVIRDRIKDIFNTATHFSVEMEVQIKSKITFLHGKLDLVVRSQKNSLFCAVTQPERESEEEAASDENKDEKPATPDYFVAEVKADKASPIPQALGGGFCWAAKQCQDHLTQNMSSSPPKYTIYILAFSRTTTLFIIVIDFDKKHYTLSQLSWINSRTT